MQSLCRALIIGSGLNLSTLATNLIPNYIFHFPVLSYAPLTTESVTEMTEMAFDSRQTTLDCDPLTSKFISCAFIYKNSPLLQMEEAIAKIRTKGLQFSISERYKYGYVNKELFVLEEGPFKPHSSSCTLINNTLSVKKVFKRMLFNFDRMYIKKSHMQWFLYSPG